MDNKLDLFQVIFISQVVATFLLNTCRITKAIDLFKECLFLLKSNVVVKEEELFKLVYKKIITAMFKAYCIMKDYTSAIQHGRNLLDIHRECGEKNEESSLRIKIGLMYQHLRKYEEAKAFYKKALAISKEIGDNLGEAKSYRKLAIVCKIQNEYVKAKEYLLKALTKRKQMGDKEGEATDCGNIGTVFYSLGEFVKAKEFSERALAISKEIVHRSEEASSYGNLGTVFASLGKNLKANEYFEKALAIRKAIGDRNGEATDYNNLGNVFRSFGEYVKAKEYHEKALAIRKEIGDREGEALSYNSLGSNFQCLGEFVKAKEYHEKALAISKEIVDKNGVASAYENIGTVFASLGENFRAKEYLERALMIRNEIGNRSGEAADYENLGVVFHKLGEYDKSKKYHEKALMIMKEICNRKGEAEVYGNLGSLFQDLGEYVKSIEYTEKALAIRNEIGDRNGEAADYRRLGVVFGNVGEYTKAIEYLEKSLAMSQDIGDKYGEGVVYGNLAVLFKLLGKYSKAKDNSEKALAIRKVIGDRDGEATDYVNLGSVFQFIGDHLEAKQYYEKALGITKKTGDRKGEAEGYVHLGMVSVCLGEYAKAKGYNDKAFAISKEIGDVLLQLGCCLSIATNKLSQGCSREAFLNIFESIKKCEVLHNYLMGNDSFKISFFDQYVYLYRLVGAMFCANKSPTEALYISELGRARALADLMSLQYHVEKQFSANPQSWSGIENSVEKEGNCTCLYISYFAQNIFLWVLKPKQAMVFRQINVNQECVLKESVRDLDEFLSKETLRKFHILPHERCEDRSLLYSNDIDPTSSPSASPEQSLEDLAGSFRPFAKGDVSHANEQHFLLYYNMIIAPITDLLGGREIIIVPDRSLYKVPFAALPDKTGKYLSETFRIRIVPSLTTLRMIQDSPADYHSQTGALIVGDPDVGRVRYNRRLKNILRLPCAAKEAKMIGELLSVQPLLGQQATKQAVLERINSVSLIHFAAHGDAERGEIALSPLRNINRIPQGEDYLLTMSDISRVQLRAKLVVLSCCHSARGQIRAEGVVGIARAFLGSGARAVLVALWALEDSATEQLMRCFYEHLVRGESASESLHEAMKRMRTNGYSDVRQWAPFMLIGDNVTFNFGK